MCACHYDNRHYIHRISAMNDYYRSPVNANFRTPRAILSRSPERASFITMSAQFGNVESQHVVRLDIAFDRSLWTLRTDMPTRTFDHAMGERNPVKFTVTAQSGGSGTDIRCELTHLLHVLTSCFISLLRPRSFAPLLSSKPRLSGECSRKVRNKLSTN
jgi:hypothetical protein